MEWVSAGIENDVFETPLHRNEASLTENTSG